MRRNPFQGISTLSYIYDKWNICAKSLIVFEMYLWYSTELLFSESHFLGILQNFSEKLLFKTLGDCNI